MRMQAAGIHLASLFSVTADILRDYRNPNPSPYVSYPWFDQYIPAAGMLSRAFTAAAINGTVEPGETIPIGYPNITAPVNATTPA